MTYALEITIPRLPKINSSRRGSRWADIKEKELWAYEVRVAVRGKKPPEPLKRAKVTYIRHSSLPPDYTNLVQSFKHPEDGLVRAGIIEDDSMKVIGRPDVRWEKTKRLEGRITMLVEEIEDA